MTFRDKYANLVPLLSLMGIIILLVFQLRQPEVTSIQTLVGNTESRQAADLSRQAANHEDVRADLANQVARPEDIGTGALSNVRAKGFLDDLKNLDLDKLSDEELLLTIHSNFDNINVICRRKFRMGNIFDGGWEICDDADVRPRGPCIIYSFGINNDFSFDDDAAAMYGCHVYSFDPSMSKEQFDRSTNVHFYKIGLDNRTYISKQKWQLYNFEDIRKKLSHHNSTIDVVKMDIESSEWPSLPQMVESGQLVNVKQLLVEYHISQQSRGYILPKLKFIQQLEKAGFKRFYVHKNPACKMKVNGMPIIRTHCYEVHYLKR